TAGGTERLLRPVLLTAGLGAVLRMLLTCVRVVAVVGRARRLVVRVLTVRMRTGGTVGRSVGVLRSGTRYSEVIAVVYSTSVLANGSRSAWCSRARPATQQPQVARSSAPRGLRGMHEAPGGVPGACSVRDTGIEPVTSSVSGKRATAA